MEIFALFFLDGMGGMVGGEAVNHVQVLPEGVLVYLGAQYRADFGKASTDVGDVVLGEEEVVRGNLAGDRQAARFGFFRCLPWSAPTGWLNRASPSRPATTR